MIRPPLDQSTWQSVFTGTAPPDKFNHVIIAPLTFRADVALVTVTTTQNDADWVRAGYVQQVWDRGDDEFLVARERVLLHTSKVFVIEPVASSFITFEPVGWLLDWTIHIEARPYSEL